MKTAVLIIFAALAAQAQFRLPDRGPDNIRAEIVRTRSDGMFKIETMRIVPSPVGGSSQLMVDLVTLNEIAFVPIVPAVDRNEGKLGIAKLVMALVKSFETLHPGLQGCRFQTDGELNGIWIECEKR